MTGSEIERVRFARDPIVAWAEADPRRTNWPVVYTIDGPCHVYVGETTQAGTRMRQHLAHKSQTDFMDVRVIVNDTFNKSVCLDLESYLIRMFAGDGQYAVANANVGLTESDYYQRETYREQFEAIFEQLRAEGLFDQTAAQIENSDLFKLSPFKALTLDQRTAVLAILQSLLGDVVRDLDRVAVVQGGPGTGKTVVAVYLMKLLVDIQNGVEPNDPDADAVFAGFFTQANADLLRGFKAALVVPQWSLRETVKQVFSKTPGLSPTMVLTPFDAAMSEQQYDLLIVDEAHRLQQLAASQQLKRFRQVNVDLFGDEQSGDQLDWIRASSRHSLLMLDTDQTVRPADIPSTKLRDVQRTAESDGRLFPLRSQLRVKAGEDYIGYVRGILSGTEPTRMGFSEYEFALFEDLGEMRRVIRDRELTHGLARLLAGFAWPWRSKKDARAFDIEIGDERLQWNRTATDWINSPTSAQEAGSIHTVQGYDLNYAGVIIGPDLRHDDVRGLHIDRASYFDVKGKANNRMRGITYTDDDLRRYITNIYSVLLTRGIRGTFIYACDPGLREYLQSFVPTSTSVLAPDMVWSPPTDGEWAPRAPRVRHATDDDHT